MINCIKWHFSLLKNLFTVGCIGFTMVAHFFMARDPDHVRGELRAIQDRVRGSAPVYKHRMEKAMSVISQFEALQNEELVLLDEITREENFLTGKVRELQEIEKSYNETAAEFEAQRQKLCTAVLKNAVLAISHNSVPHIALFDTLRGESPRVEQSRILAQIIEMKASLLKKQDRIRELRRRIFCLDDGESFVDGTTVSGNDDTESFELIRQLNETVNQNPISADECAVNELSRFVESELQSQKLETLDVNLPRLHYSPVQSFGVEPFSFDKLKPLFDHAAKEELRLKINMTWTDVARLITKIREEMSRRSEEYKSFCETEYVFCSDLIYKVQDQVAVTQATLVSVSKSIVSNSPGVWADEHAAISAMYELVLILRRFIEKMSREIVMNKLGGFDPIEVHEVTADVTSSVQISKCLELMQTIEANFSRDMNLQDKFFQQIKDLQKTFEEMRMDVNIDNLLMELPKPVLVDDSEDRALFAELQKEVYDRQAAQLRELQEALSGLPENIKTLAIREELASEEEGGEIPEEVPTVELPVVRTVTDHSSLEEMISESNMYLLDKIKQRKFGLAPLSQSVSPPESKSYTLDESGQTLLTEVREKIMATVCDQDIEALEARRNALLDQLAEIRATLARDERERMEKYQQRLQMKSDDVSQSEDLEKSPVTEQGDAVTVKSEPVIDGGGH